MSTFHAIVAPFAPCPTSRRCCCPCLCILWLFSNSLWTICLAACRVKVAWSSRLFFSVSPVYSVVEMLDWSSGRQIRKTRQKKRKFRRRQDVSEFVFLHLHVSVWRWSTIVWVIKQVTIVLEDGKKEEAQGTWANNDDGNKSLDIKTVKFDMIGPRRAPAMRYMIIICDLSPRRDGLWDDQIDGTPEMWNSKAKT